MNAPSMMDSLLSTSATSTPAAVKLFVLLSVMSFATAALVCMTSFTRLIIVLSFLRQALGAPQLPPNQVLLGLALFLTAFIMAPTLDKLNTQALEPFMEDKQNLQVTATRAGGVLKEFMLKHTQEEDLRLFYTVSNRPRPVRGEEIPLTVVAPAYLLSELATAFKMGLYVLVPMLLVDLLVSSLLLSLGMMMLPPALVSLPLKLALFVMVDGWRLVVSSLVRSFG